MPPEVQPLLEFMNFVFTHMPYIRVKGTSSVGIHAGENHCSRRLRSLTLLLCLCDIFQVFINSLAC